MTARFYRLTALLLLFSMVASCESRDEPVFHDQFFAFGTLIEISFYGVEPVLATTASEQMEQDLLAMHDRWHAWQPGPLADLNSHLARLEPYTADQTVLPLLLEAGRLSELSKGLFNPFIGKLVALWGFHDNALPIGTLPDAASIKALVDQSPDWTDIVIDGAQITSRNPAVSYDLGGFAKGYAIDRIINNLRALGIQNAIVNAGGDLRAIGQHGDRPWRIGIRHPRKNSVFASIELTGDTSVFTSGDYERYFEVDGKRYHHIIDPRTGYPATGTASVTVIHDNAATADAAATALFVAGPDNWVGIARNMGVKLVMLIDTDGVIYMNSAMQSRIHFEVEPNTEIRLSEPLS